jgi:hypothetical protein
MTKTTTKIDPPRGPGLARLRKAKNAEAIRNATLADQKRAVAGAKPKGPAKAQKRPASAHRSIPAPKPRGKAKGPPAARLAPAPGIGKRAAILAAAERGEVPAPPNFSAPTHTRFRPKLAEVVALAEAGDLKALKAWRYAGFMSTSPKAIERYRTLCVTALEARQ